MFYGLAKRARPSNRPPRQKDADEAAIMAVGTRRTLLLLTLDEQLAQIVAPLLNPAWTLIHQNGHYTAPAIFAHPNIRIVVLDDATVAESDRGWLLNRIRKNAADASLIYVAGNHSQDGERLARGNGAHYYASKPLSPELFGHVLKSFMRARG
jgi:DNA-binding response OmpR family regulator